jgi:signal transduction histidine kinase
MGMIDTIFSSPIPTIIAMMLALAFGAVIWWFAIPQAAQLKEALATIVDKDEEIKELRTTHTDDLKKMSQMLSEILAIVERPVSIPALEELRSLLNSMSGALNGNRHLDSTTVRELQNCMNTIDRNTERLLRTLSEVSEKQSQVSGIILGLNMHRGEAPRGV